MIWVGSGRVASGQVRLFSMHIQSTQNDLGWVGSGQVRSVCLTCTLRACRMIRVRSGQVRVFNMHIQGMQNDSGWVGSGQSV